MGALCILGVLAVTNTLVAAVGIHGAAKWEHGAGPLVPWDMPLFGIPEHSGLKSLGFLSLCWGARWESRVWLKSLGSLPAVWESWLGFGVPGCWHQPGPVLAVEE